MSTRRISPRLPRAGLSTPSRSRAVLATGAPPAPGCFLYEWQTKDLREKSGPDELTVDSPKLTVGTEGLLDLRVRQPGSRRIPPPPAFLGSAYSKGLRRSVLRKCGFQRGYNPCSLCTSEGAMEVFITKGLRKKACGSAESKGVSKSGEGLPGYLAGKHAVLYTEGKQGQEQENSEGADVLRL